MSDICQIIARQVNYSLVQLPNRKFPGLLVQGDSLKSLSELVGELREAHGKGEVDDVVAAIDELSEVVGSFVNSYESMMRQNSLPLPYVAD